MLLQFLIMDVDHLKEEEYNISITIEVLIIEGLTLIHDKLLIKK